MEAAIHLERVSKTFRVRRNAPGHLKVWVIAHLAGPARPRIDELRALQEVTLSVRPGECLGVIGANGSGKSTLLRLIAGIYPPTAGTVVVRGSVAPVTDLGVGFHPDLTGRESVYLSTSLYRLTRRQTDRVYRPIVEFAELDGFMDIPTRHYSTGMVMRLGFAIAAHLDADILLLDEALAVGDLHFQAKCLDRLAQIRRRGTTIVMASHDLGSIACLADRVCLLERGRVVACGEPPGVVEAYRAAGPVPVAVGPD